MLTLFMLTCQNNPEKSYTEKKAEHIPSDYSILTFFSFDKSKNERKYYQGEDCMIMFCKNLKEQAMKIINCDKKNDYHFIIRQLAKDIKGN